MNQLIKIIKLKNKLYIADYYKAIKEKIKIH